jgi:aspartyl-tRNA(Asn)/glutamyl-tRNA(Gln) amidotransferase subunit A
MGQDKMAERTSKICELSGAEQAKLIRERELSPVEVMEAVLQRIEKLNPELNAFCVLDAEGAMNQAKQAEQAVMSGKELRPLHGVPVGIKDLVATKGMRTTFGSKLYEDFVPDEDDICVARLRDAGAIVIGKTNVPEFGYQGITDNKVFGLTRSPWDPSKTPGGSSGGSGAAVASGMVPLAIGNDGGGSIRLPSSFCGLYGIKPSFGRVPLYPGCRDPQYSGASSWESLECNGPMTRTVTDSALMLSVIAGPSNMDRHSLPDDGLDYLAAIRNPDLKGLRVAFSPDWGYAAVDPRVRSVVENAVKVFERLGCQVEIAHPGFTDPLDAFWALVARDTDLRGLRKLAEERADEMGAQLRGLLDIEWTAEQFTDAHFVRQDVANRMNRFMSKYDLLLTPTLAVPPFEHGINGPTEIDGRQVSEAQWLAFTFPLNLTGQPAASIPAGWTDDGLPIGLQIVGRHLDDLTVLRASAAYEAANPWQDRWPEMVKRLG